jgi:Leucine-rich repeat (LRR) protein
MFALLGLFVLFPAQKLNAQYVYSGGDPSSLAAWTPAPPNFLSGTFTINTAAIMVSNWTLGGTATLTVGAAGSLTINTGFVLTANSTVTMNGALTMSGAGNQLVLNAGVQIILGPTSTVGGTGLIKADNSNTVRVQAATLTPAQFTSGWIFRLIIDRATDVSCMGNLTVGNGGLDIANTGNFVFNPVGYTLTVEDGVGVTRSGMGKISLVGGGNGLNMRDDNLNGDHYVPGMNNLYINRAGGVNLTNTLDICNLGYTSGALNINNTGNLIGTVCGGIVVPAGRTLNINTGGRVTVLPGKYFNNDGIVNVNAGGMLVLDADGTGNSTVGGMNPINYTMPTSILRYTATGTPPAKLAGNELPAPTMPGRIEVARTGANVLQINKVTTILGGIDVQSGFCDITAGSTITLGAASQVQNAAYMRMLSNSTLTGGNNLTVQPGGTLGFSGTTISWTGTPTYSATLPRGNLLYGSVTMPTGVELPGTMNGNVLVRAGAVASDVTLSANTIVNGQFTIDYAGGANSEFSLNGFTLTLNNAVNELRTGTLSRLNINGGSRLLLNNGSSFANLSGVVTLVNNTSILEMNGTAAYTGTSPVYTGNQGQLHYTGTNPSAITGAEFPPMGVNTLIINRAIGNTLVLQNAKTVGGTTTITQGILQSSAVGASLVQNLGTVSIAGNARLRVQENSTMNGTYTYTNPGVLEYAGSNTASMGNEMQIPTMNGNVIINNSMGVTMSASHVIANNASLTLTTGRLITGGNTIRVNNLSLFAVNAGTGYVDGTLIRALPNTSVGYYLFPVGVGLSPRSFEVTGFTGTTPVVSVQASNQGAGTGINGLNGIVNMPLATEFWTASFLAGSFNAGTGRVRLRPTAVGGTSTIGNKTGAIGGNYDNIGGNVSAPTIESAIATPLLGNFAVGAVQALTGFVPANIQAGSAAFTLRVNGTGFPTAPVSVQFGGTTGIIPSAVTATYIEFTVPAAEILAPGTRIITITGMTNPAMSAGYSVTAPPPPPFTATATLNPVADSHVRDDSPGMNYGTATTMFVAPPTGGTNAYSLMRFNLATIPAGSTVVSAELRVTSRTGFAYGGDGNTYVEYINDNAWGEGTVTWAAPPMLTPLTAMGNWFQWYGFPFVGPYSGGDLQDRLNIVSTPALATQVKSSLATGLISFRLQAPGYMMEYYTRESANPPQLRVVYNPPVSLNSDVIAVGGETANIPYDALPNQGTNVTNMSSSLMRLRVRDGGAGVDADTYPTVLTAITVNIPNWNQLNHIALYDATGTNEIVGTDQAVSGPNVTFTGLNLSTLTDGGTAEFVVRATFQPTVTDNTNVRLTVTNVTSQAGFSGFAAPNGGGAASSNLCPDNCIAVNAARLIFQTNPPATVNAAVMVAPSVTVRAEDNNGNLDVDYTGTITLANPNLLAGGSVAAVAGVATFPGLVFFGAAAALPAQMLNATSAPVLTPASSAAFTINPSTFHQMLATANANVLTNWQLNGVGASPFALGVPGATYRIGATPGAATSDVTITALLTIANTSAFEVNAGSTLIVANGVLVTNNGAVNINANGTLRLLGSGVIGGLSTSDVTYAGPSSTLEYAGPVALSRITTPREMPTMFNGSLRVTRPAGGGTELYFDGNKTIAGAFDKSGAGDIIINNTNTITVNGATTFSAGNVTIDNTAHFFTNGAFTKSAGNIIGAGNGRLSTIGAFNNTMGDIIWNSASDIAFNGATTWDAGTLNMGGAGNAIVGATGSFTLNGGSLTLANTGTFTSDGTFANPSGNIAIGNSTFILNGPINWGGGGINSAIMGTVRILGMGGITGTFNNISGGYGLFEMNRAGQTLILPLGVNLITTNLTLNNGIIRSQTGQRIEVTNTFTAPVPSATTHIDGALRLSLDPLSSGLVNAGPFTFPLGKGGQYLPLTLLDVNGTGTIIQAEAFNAGSGGMAGTAIMNVSTTEYWQTQPFGAGTFTSARVQLGRTTPPVTPATVVGRSGKQTGTYNGLGGGVSVPTVQSITPFTAANSFFALGVLPNVFYYNSGNAATPSNWNSELNGTGVGAVDFATMGATYIVPNSRTATFLTDATFTSPAQFLQVEGGGTVEIATGRTLTSNILFRVNALARLRLNGTGDVVAPSGVQYLDARAILEYNGASNRLTSDVTFPPPAAPIQPGIHVRNGSIVLNASKLVNTFTLDTASVRFGAGALNANTLTVNGALTGTGTSTLIADSSNRLSITGTGAITGSFGLSGKLGSLTMNRVAQTLTFASNLAISTTLTLTAGNIATSGMNAVLVQSPVANAILGGSANSYVVGMLSRSLAPNLSAMNPSNYAYPIGTVARFLGAALVNSTTGSAGADVGLEAFTSAAGGSVAPGVNGALSTTEYWRTLVLGGEFLGSAVTLTRTTPTLNPQSRIGTSPTRTGAYSSLASALSGATLQSDPVQHGTTPFAALSSERFYSILGILPNAPRITGFSPSSGGIGTVIRVTGANLTGVNAVAIGDVPVNSFSLINDSAFTASIGNGVSGAVQVSGTNGGAASDSIFRFVPPPSIGIITPNPAGYGTPITIPGNNLGGAVFISIGGVQIPVTPDIYLPSGDIRVSVPVNASNATLIITTPGGTVESTNALVLVPRPVITAVSPQIASTGEVISIIGQNLQTTRFVRFGGGTSRIITTNAGFTVNGATRLSVIVPPQVRRPLGTTATLALQHNGGQTFSKETSELASVEIVPITVETAGGQATAGTIPATQFVYRTTAQGMGSGGGTGSFPQVRVDAVLDRITTPGGRVRVTGANLDIIADMRLSTRVGSIQGTWFNASPNAVTIGVPLTGLLSSTAQTLASAVVTLEVFGPFNSVIVTNAFTIVGAPTILTIQPPNAEPGETITVTGTNLVNVTGATIGGQNVPFRLDPNGNIVLTVPVARTTNGEVNPVAGTLQLQGVGGTSTASATPVNAPYLTGLPVITSFSPSTGGGGTVIVVTGANFSAITDVTVGGIPVQSFVLNSSGRLTIILSTEAAARSLGTINLITPRGIVESRQSFTFTQSLERDVQELARAIGLAPSVAQTRIRTENNRIISLDLSGIPLPNGAFPEYLRGLRGLRFLNLSNTGLVGPIPSWMSELVDLEELDISRNQLTGELSGNVVCLYPNLRLLNVSSNKLEGAIPLCITTRERVQTLRLDNNRFTGSILAELGTMPNLRILTLNNNSLTGGLPTTFGAINTRGKTTTTTQDAQSLEVLDVSNNQLSGEIPPAFGNMLALKTLNLANNRFSGRVPQELGNISLLEHLNLSANRFTGDVPITFAQLSRLRSLRLQENGFTSMPNIALPRRLDTLEMQRNRLDFASIEPFIALRSAEGVRFGYTPQDSIGAAESVEARIGESLTLRVNVGGSENEYQWFKNGTAFTVPSNQATVRFSAIQSDDAGVYLCRITSRRVPDLVLLSRPQTITITRASLSLAAPELVYPTNAAENIGVQTRLTWQRVAGADGYEVQWAEDANLRANVERRYVQQTSRDTVSIIETRVSGLQRGVQVFWRVRAVVGADAGNGIGTGSTSNQATSTWSEVRRFGVVPLGVDVAIATIDAGKASIGDETFGQSVAVNVGSDAVQITNLSVDAADAAQFRLKTSIPAGQMIQLAAGAEFPIELAFTPRQTGIITGTLTMQYRDGQGTMRSVNFRAVARGSGSALRVETVNFDTIRVGRTTFRTALLVNRSNETVRVTGASISAVRTSNGTVFTMRDLPSVSEPLFIAAGDTVPLLLAARPATSGLQQGTIQILVSDSAQNGRRFAERVEVALRAIARVPQPNDAFVRLGIRPTLDSIAPGGVVTMEVYIAEGNKQAVLAATDPRWRGTVRFSKQVVTIQNTPRERLFGAKIIPDRTGTSDMQRVALPETRWDGRSDVLFQFDALAVAGDTDKTLVEIESLAWGNANAQAQREAWESQVFVEEPVAHVFTAEACKAGGKRLVTSARPTALAVVRPNPVKDIAEVAMTLREDGAMVLELVNMSGSVVKTVMQGDVVAGEYTVPVPCSDLPSGTYMIRLRTPQKVISQTITVVR